MLVAEYTNGSKRRPATLDLNIIENGRREFIFQHVVTGKVEARKIAAARGAKCWNF